MASIKYVTGDATQPQGEGTKLIVHICNDIGAWGKGFVMALSARWTEPETKYRDWYQGKETIPFELGQVQFVQVQPDIWVANMLGQHDIRSRSGIPPIRYEAVRAALQKVAVQAKQSNATVHMPRIGAGLAGGRWEEIEAIILEELVQVGVEVSVYDLPKL